MRPLVVVRARVVGCGDLLGLLNEETGQMEFWSVLSARNLPDQAAMVAIHMAKGSEERTFTYPKRSRVLVNFMGGV